MHQPCSALLVNKKHPMTPPHHYSLQADPATGVVWVQMCSARAFGKHWHDTFGFGLMDAGGQKSASGRGPVQAVAGQIITTNPGEVHDGIPLQQQARRWRMVFVPASLLCELVGTGTGTELEWTQPVLDDVLVRGALHTLLTPPSAGMTSALSHGMRAEALAQAAGLLVQRHSNRVVREERPTSLCAVRECLLDQLQAPPTLQELAQLGGLSRFQLVRQFAQAHGLPPFAWLLQQRLRRAQEQIAQGVPLSQAAYGCGFADQSHLTRAFAKHLGFSPGAWQRAHAPGVQ